MMGEMCMFMSPFMNIGFRYCSVMDWLINANGDVESIPDYDCTDSDRKTGYTNIWFGISFLIYGVIAEKQITKSLAIVFIEKDGNRKKAGVLVYSIVLSVMMRKQHSRLSCYKIMIALGVNDMAALMVNSLLTGYLWIIGANYCYSPKLIFIAGSMGLGKFLLKHRKIEEAIGIVGGGGGGGGRSGPGFTKPFIPPESGN
uniref:G_PROTEIN_RECEP_F1_2 domain-containing protein n=1 Tax=Angiostrongylus cantonensis TaxID=6313 RepID=A0A0K0DND7_ANGCA